MHYALQVAAQALCLEEMLCCEIPFGYIYYGEIRHREKIEFDTRLREKVESMFAEMHKYFAQKYTPRAKYRKSCNACSLKDKCLKKKKKNSSVGEYIAGKIYEGDDEE